MNRGMRASAADMLRSLLVVIAAVALLVLLVPRPTSVPRPSVDLQDAAGQAATALGFAPATPLPEGWSVTSARVRRDTGDLPSWTINYLTEQGRSVGLVQAAGWTALWQSSLTHGGEEQSPVTVGGLVWQSFVKPERSLTSLLHREDGRSTLVLAKGGGLSDAERLAEQFALADSSRQTP